MIGQHFLGVIDLAVVHDAAHEVGLPAQEIAGEQRILAAGGEGDMVFARYAPDGSLDAEFGTDGKVSANVGRTPGLTRHPPPTVADEA